MKNSSGKRKTLVSRNRRARAMQGERIPNLDAMNIEKIAHAITEKSTRKMSWSIVINLAEEITGFRYSRQSLSGKKPISSAFSAKRKNAADRRVRSRRIRIRSGEDLATVAALRLQISERDRLIEDLRKRLQTQDNVMDRLLLRMQRWFSNTSRRTLLTEQDLDEPIRYLARQ